MNKLEHLKALCEKATPGPWTFINSHLESDYDNCPKWEVLGPERFDDQGNDFNFCFRTFKRTEAEYIAAVDPQTILKLLYIIEIQGKALLSVDWAIKNCDWECERCNFDPKMDDCDFVAECREALTAVDGILGEV
jgi:hypothetical protein